MELKDKEVKAKTSKQHMSSTQVFALILGGFCGALYFLAAIALVAS